MNATEPAIMTSPELALDLKKALSAEASVRKDERLSRRTTLRVGGPADIFVEPATEADLSETLRFCQTRELPLMMLGRGSNLLVRDGGIRGVVVSLNHPSFAAIEVQGTNVTAGAGARMRAVAVEAKRASLTGLEFMEGIPGNIGGGLRMNAGAMGSSVFQVVESMRFMDRFGNVSERTASEIPVDYRSCPLLRENIALSAVLIGNKAARDLIDQRMNECSQKRWKSQPAAPSAGCIFKNSPSIPTGKLVEELGLKGMRAGGAVISPVHGNFIVNDQNARARDIIELIELVKEKARSERGIELHTEVQIVGEEA